MPVEVSAQGTPNPNAMKFTLDQNLTSGTSRTFSSVDEAAGDVLAGKLFAITGVKAVFFLNNFITITKDADASWDSIAPVVQNHLLDHFA